MVKKEVIGDVLNQLRLTRQRAAFEGMPEGVSETELNSTLAQLLLIMEHLDEVIGEAPTLGCMTEVVCGTKSCISVCVSVVCLSVVCLPA